MRFAYIDSQGNEVPIPSVDALALRIELGAVRPETQLYDAQADHWGPAHTHEIFHSLSRDLEGEDFLAPPPPVASTTEVDTQPEPAPPPAAPRTEAEAEAEAEPEPIDEAASDGGSDFGLTLADPVPTPFREVDRDLEENRALGDIVVEEAKAGELPVLAGAEPNVVEEGGPVEPAEESDVGEFDFGDLGTDLESGETPSADDLTLERGTEFEAPAEGDLGGGGDELQLEQPMSAFQPGSPPGWMEEPEPEEVMDFSTPAAEEEAVEESLTVVTEVPSGQRRAPKDRPSPPKFKTQRSMSAPIVVVVVLLAIGVGGYYAWPIVQGRFVEQDPSERPPVVMPVIPQELLPQMRAIGESAIADVVSEVSEATLVTDAPTAPDDDWLAGVYLGNASQYEGVEAFWASMDAFVRGLRAAEWQLYHDRYAEGVAAAGLAADVAGQLTERADSGFVAAQTARAQAYAELERLVDGALDLHDFLVQNESDIVFRPGATSATDPTVDPVLEIAAPDDDRARMLEMFDEITEALDALGSLDRVTRDRLVDAMTARLQQVGIE